MLGHVCAHVRTRTACCPIAYFRTVWCLPLPRPSYGSHISVYENKTVYLTFRLAHPCGVLPMRLPPLTHRHRHGVSARARLRIGGESQQYGTSEMYMRDCELSVYGSAANVHRCHGIQRSPQLPASSLLPALALLHSPRPQTQRDTERNGRSRRPALAD
eukprot:scaffold33134_cov129-Isochrysis_galbana.AAC.1